jgi:hypothetical protein
MRKRKIGGIEIIVDPDRGFSDEWGVRDTVLSVTEEQIVRAAGHILGVPFGYTPTGRYVSLLLQHCMNLSLQNAAAASAAGEHKKARRWQTEYLRAKHGLGHAIN